MVDAGTTAEKWLYATESVMVVAVFLQTFINTGSGEKLILPKNYWIMMSANVGTGSGRQELVVIRRLILGFFNPEIQQKKFDKNRNLYRQWIKEFDLGYGEPMVEHAMARNRAIATYEGL
jgi:deoxyribodipyrimidine photo-lyase